MPMSCHTGARQQSRRPRQEGRQTLVAILVAVSCLAAIPSWCGVPAPVWGSIATAALGSLASLGYKATDVYCLPENVLFRELRCSYPPIISNNLVDYKVDSINTTLHQERGGLSVVYGPHHCGKTAFVKKRLCEMAAERCVRYVEADSSETTFEVVKRAIFGDRRGFVQSWLAKFFSEPKSPINLAGFSELFKTVAVRRKKKGLLVPILVIDEVNRMRAEHAADLVWFAKSLADAEAMNIVLLISPGKRSIDLLKAPAMSRGKLLLMPDPPRVAVRDAFKMRLKTPNKYISPTDIDKIYDLVGGRWEDIDEVYFFMEMTEKFDFELYKDSRFNAMETKVGLASIEADMHPDKVLAFLKRVQTNSVELSKKGVTDDEYKIALALVKVNLLKTVMSKAGALYVEFHGMVVQKFMETRP